MRTDVVWESVRLMRQIHIVARGPGWDDEIYGEVWGVNEVHLVRDVDVVVDVHDLGAVLDGSLVLGRRSREAVVEHVNELRRKDLPVWSVKRLLGCPFSMEYPKDEVTERFGTDYFGSGVDWAIALALYLGYRDIELHGILMIGKDEYAWQKPSCEYWIGRAHSMGVSLKVVGNYSSLLKTRDLMMYGYNEPQVFDEDADPEKGDIEKLKKQVGL